MSTFMLDVNEGARNMARTIRRSGYKVTYMPREYEPYINLANAIVAQAFKDYRKQLKKLKSEGTRWPIKNSVLRKRLSMEDRNSPLWRIVELEDFFQSGWFRILTNVNPEYIKTVIYEEVYGDV